MTWFVESCWMDEFIFFEPLPVFWYCLDLWSLLGVGIEPDQLLSLIFKSFLDPWAGTVHKVFHAPIGEGIKKKVWQICDILCVGGPKFMTDCDKGRK